MVRTAYSTIEPEPPPPPETILQHPTIDEQQWIKDAIYSANLDINCIQETNTLTNDEKGYSPFIRKLQNKAQHDLHLLRARHHGTSLPPPNAHPIHIPTPKCHILTYILHDTAWKDERTRDWIKNVTGGWDVPCINPTTFDIHDNNDTATRRKSPPYPFHPHLINSPQVHHLPFTKWVPPS